jgi:hypothetical protein
MVGQRPWASMGLKATDLFSSFVCYIYAMNGLILVILEPSKVAMTGQSIPTPMYVDFKSVPIRLNIYMRGKWNMVT